MKKKVVRGIDETFREVGVTLSVIGYSLKMGGCLWGSNTAFERRSFEISIIPKMETGAEAPAYTGFEV